MYSSYKLLLSLTALAAATVAVRADNTPTDIANDLANGKSTTTTGYYNSGTETFPSSNVTNEQFGDTGSPSNWSFWLTPQSELGTVTINLGSAFDLTQFDLQDTHNRDYYDRGTDGFTISTSLDGISFTPLYTGAFTAAQWENLTWVDLAVASTEAQYVQFTVNSMYGGQSAGLNELQAFGTAVGQQSSVPDSGLGLGLTAATLAALLFAGRRAFGMAQAS